MPNNKKRAKNLIYDKVYKQTQMFKPIAHGLKYQPNVYKTIYSATATLTRRRCRHVVFNYYRVFLKNNSLRSLDQQWWPVSAHLLLVPSYPPPSYSRANKKLSRRPPLTYGWLPFYLFLLFQKPWVCSTQTVQGTPCILLGLGIARPATLCSLCSLLVMEGRNKLSGARLQSPKFSPSNLTSSRFLVNPVLLPWTLYLPPLTPGPQLEPCLSSVLDQILPITGSEWIRIPDAPSRGCQ